MPLPKTTWLDAWILDAITKKVIEVEADGTISHRGQRHLAFGMINVRHAGATALVPAARIIAVALLPNPFAQPDVIQANGIMADCRVENLYWGVRDWSKKIDLKAPTLSAADFLAIRASKLKTDELARRYRLSEPDVRRIRKHHFGAYVG